MKVVIVGCGRMGAELATRMFQAGHEVSIIDSNPRAFEKLPPGFEGRLSEGEAINKDVLHRSGIESADTVAVVTDSDVLNAVVGHLARTVYNVRNVVVRNHDPRYRPIQEAFGLQAVSAMSWGSQRIEEMLYDAAFRTVFSAGNGEVEIYEIAISEEWSGHAIGDLVKDSGVVPVSVTRAGRAAMPSANMVLETGDVLHVSATISGIEQLRKRMGVGD